MTAAACIAPLPFAPAARESILRRIAGGDADSMASLVARFAARVRAIARQQLSNLHDIEDAVQDVFVSLWRSASRFDPREGSETTFVMTLARRRVIDRRRSITRQRAPTPMASTSELQAPERGDPAELREESDRARRAVDRLRPAQRRVLRLSVYDGHSHGEIARRTGLPLGTVKSHARRGLQSLRKKLDAGAVDVSPETA